MEGQQEYPKDSVNPTLAEEVILPRKTNWPF